MRFCGSSILVFALLLSGCQLGFEHAPFVDPDAGNQDTADGAGDTSDVDALPSCTDPEIRCGEACVDPQSDEANCGMCGTTCDPALSCVAGACIEPPCDWWNAEFEYRRRITIFAGASPVPAGFSGVIELDHGILVGAGHSQRTGDDVRLVRCLANSNAEVPLVVDPERGFDRTDTLLYFSIADALAPSEQDASFYLYYGNPAAPARDDDWSLFRAADRFDDGSLSGLFDVVTTGSGSVVEDATMERLQITTANGDGALVAHQFGSWRQFSARVSIRVDDADSSANRNGVVLLSLAASSNIPAPDSPAAVEGRRIVSVIQAVDGTIMISRADADDALSSWDGANGAWLSGARFIAGPALGETYVADVLATANQWTIEVRDTLGNVVAKTDTVRWTDSRPVGSELWLYFGDPFSTVLSASAQADWVLVRESLPAPPINGLGPVETQQ